MARLARNGSELLRVERMEGESVRTLAFMSKGSILEKVSLTIDGEWTSGDWCVRGKRRIGTEMIRDVKEQFEAAGWRVVFYDVRQFQERGDV